MFNTKLDASSKEKLEEQGFIVYESKLLDKNGEPMVYISPKAKVGFDLRPRSILNVS